MTRLTHSQTCTHKMLTEAIRATPPEYRLRWIRATLLDTEDLAALESWFERGASETANLRHAKRMDQYNSTDIAMMGRRL